MSKEIIGMMLPTSGDIMVKRFNEMLGVNHKNGCGIVILLNLPTGEVLATSNMTDDEYQQFLEFVCKNNKGGRYDRQEVGRPN